MGFAIRRLIGCLENSQGAGGSVALTAWPAARAGYGFHALGGLHKNFIDQIGFFPRTVSTASWSGGTLTVTTTAAHLLYTGSWVELVGVDPAAMNGYYRVTGVTSSTIFTVALASDPGAFVSAPAKSCVLWTEGRYAAFPSLTVSATAALGIQTTGAQGSSTNLYVPYNLRTGIVQIASCADSGGLIKITTSANHGFSTGNVVEVTGLRMSSVSGDANGVSFCDGVWTITVVDADEFTLDGSVFPSGETVQAASGIVSLHTNAVSRRAYLLSGDADNAGAGAFTAVTETTTADRGYGEAYNAYRTWLESHADYEAGYYFSTGNVGTPFEVERRGEQGGYPFALVLLDEAYTNGWSISTSQTNGGLLQLTLGKTPPAWTSSSTVRMAIFGHSNPSYGMDRKLDKSDAFTLLKGKTGTSTSAASATVLTDSGASFDYTVLGRMLHITGGTRSGESRRVVDFTATTLTVASAFSGNLGLDSTYLCGTDAHPISAVSGSNVTLRTDFMSANGTGGCVLIMGPLAASNSVTDSGVSNGAGGNYMQLNTADAHGLAVGDYVVVTNTSVAGYNQRTSTASQVDSTGTRVTIRKVLSVVDTDSVVVDGTYTSAANGGTWFGTCLSIAPSGYSSSTRIDQPDYRRSDVRELFNTDLKAHIDTIFARHGARHIGVFDETSLRHSSSAAVDIAISGSLCGETSLEMIQRIGEVGTYLRNTYGVQINPNCTGWLHKDGLSSAERSAIISTWGGITSETTNQVWDRSYYQMVEGWLTHVSTLLTNGCAYYFQPQSASFQGPYSINADARAYAGAGNYLGIRFSSDTGTYPTAGETTAGGHNHSGQLIGVYGHGTAGLNGVHRINGRTATANEVRTETYWDGTLGGGGATGSMVWHQFATPMKVTSLTAGASGSVRVTTEFPHGIPNGDEAHPYVKIYGYRTDATKNASGTPTSAAVYAARRVSSTTFDLVLEDGTDELTYSADDTTTVGICFYFGAANDFGAMEEYWYGISYLLWEPGYPIWFNRGGRNRHSVYQQTHEAVHAWIPSDLDPDGPYTVVTFSGTATSGSTTTIVDSGAAFTDAVLGEQVCITAGTNNGEWRRITARTGTQLTVSPAFSGAIDATSAYTVGKTAASDVTKVLELKRTFNGGTRTVQVFPQQTYVTYTGFTWDTDA